MELFAVSHFLYQSYTTAPVLALRIILDRRFWGVEETGVSVDLFQVPETLSLDALKALSAAQKPADVMVLDRSFLNQLSFGPASCQNGLAFQTWWNANPFWHDAGPNESLLWWHRWAGWPRNHPLHGPDTVDAPWHGLTFPSDKQAGGDGQFDLSEIHGISPWGASTLAGADGSRQPSQLELKCASKHGQVLGNAVKRTVAPAPNCKFKVAVIYCSMCLDTRCWKRIACLTFATIIGPLRLCLE